MAEDNDTLTFDVDLWKQGDKTSLRITGKDAFELTEMVHEFARNNGYSYDTFTVEEQRNKVIRMGRF